MTSTENHQQAIDAFESHYQYDCTYMRQLLASSPEAYQLFADFLPMAQFRQRLPLNEYWVAKLAVMQQADCGACLQLQVKMAIEQGVSTTLIQSTLNNHKPLPETLQQVKDYAQQLTLPAGVDSELMQTMRERYDQGQLLEFGLCAASATVFPTIKRAIAEIQSCAVIDIEVA